MSYQKRFTGLRAGFVTAAARVKDGTVRAWRLNNGLKVGDGGEGEQRRYSLADAARLTLMKALTEDFAMSAASAAFLVNMAHQRIGLLGHLAMYRLDHPEQGAPAVQSIMVAASTDGTKPPEFFLPEELAGLDRRRSHELRIDLGLCLESALDMLIIATGGSTGTLDTSDVEALAA